MQEELETLGIVKGTTVRAKYIGKDIKQALKSVIGGELKAYSQMMDEARDIATQRMVTEANELGADGIVNIRYASTAFVDNAAEVIAYGTAVKFK